MISDSENKISLFFHLTTLYCSWIVFWDKFSPLFSSFPFSNPNRWESAYCNEECGGVESSKAAFCKIILGFCFLKLRPRRERELHKEVDVSRNLKEEEFCQTKKGFLCREKWTREVYWPEPVGPGGLPGCILVGSKAQGK